MREFKFIIENLGVIRHAEFEPGRMTLLCGQNNTGKTYVAYAFYGFLDYYMNHYIPEIPIDLIDNLVINGNISINIVEIASHEDAMLVDVCGKYIKTLPNVLANSQKSLLDASVNVEMTADVMYGLGRSLFLQGLVIENKVIVVDHEPILSISKEKGNNMVVISLLNKERAVDKNFLLMVLSTFLKVHVFGSPFPRPFIFSAERTGAAIFRNELDFARNRILEKMVRSDGNQLNPLELLSTAYSNYASPVNFDVDFVRRLENIVDRESFIVRDHAQILERFSKIIGGDSQVIRGKVVFVPSNNKNIRLGINEVSSSVKSLLAFGYYLRHMAAPGDMVIIDEPELNLHPENQRLLARLLARLCNIGLNVFITTHSDYIVKELNTLIMLKREHPAIQAVRKKHGYQVEECLSFDDVKIYIAEEESGQQEGRARRRKGFTLTPASGNEKYGFIVESFNSTIDQMNKIEDDISFSGEDD
ncbi:MAG: AAA family ATPase [Magnetococcales bacterium]|nr:AAA family ATPase [Magnetococcales bacterium]NGZ26715.1 AAA family ATPase [Magnetococcales bacterium]